MDDPSGDLLSLVSHQDQVSTKPGQLHSGVAHQTDGLSLLHVLLNRNLNAAFLEVEVLGDIPVAVIDDNPPPGPFATVPGGGDRSRCGARRTPLCPPVLRCHGPCGNGSRHPRRDHPRNPGCFPRGSRRSRASRTPTRNRPRRPHRQHQPPPPSTAPPPPLREPTRTAHTPSSRRRPPPPTSPKTEPMVKPYRDIPPTETGEPVDITPRSSADPTHPAPDTAVAQQTPRPRVQCSRCRR